MFTVWYADSEELANWIIHNTKLKYLQYKLRQLYKSDAENRSKFYWLPTHVKQILYLDCPDVIIARNGKPLISIEISKEAGTGHNVFQRFGRLLASVENGVPSLYIYPEAVWIKRQNTNGRWDRINPLIFKAIERATRIHGIPVLLFYFPSYFNGNTTQRPPNPEQKGLRFDPNYPACPDADDPEMKALFDVINKFLDDPGRALRSLEIDERRTWMITEYCRKGGDTKKWSPLTSVIEVPTEVVLKYIKDKIGDNTYEFNPDFLPSRKTTVIYVADSKFRADPYAGALSAIDYLKCRTGRTYEDREKNLAIAWGKIIFDEENGVIKFLGNNSSNRSVNCFVNRIRNIYHNPNNVLLNRSFRELEPSMIPRYMMQVRFGTTFTKPKEIRMYAYFADIMIFHDGVLWREG